VLAFGLEGVALIVPPGTSLPDPALAIFIPLALVAPFFYAVEGNIVGRWGTLGLDPIQGLFGASAVGLVAALPLAVGTGHFIDPHADWGAPAAAIVLSSVVHAGVYAGYVWMVGHAGPVFAAQVSYLVTAFGVIWAMVILGERFPGTLWLTKLTIFAGLFLVQPRPSAPVAAPSRLGQDAA
jgi:drug/metabolite transporter (DMT)-like permease